MKFLTKVFTAGVFLGAIASEHAYKSILNSLQHEDDFFGYTMLEWFAVIKYATNNSVATHYSVGHRNSGMPVQMLVVGTLCDETYYQWEEIVFCEDSTCCCTFYWQPPWWN